MSIYDLIEANDIDAIDAIAAKNGMAESRIAQRHAAAWHNIQLPQFARIVAMAFGGKVAVLPNADVFKAAQEIARKAKTKIPLSVEVAETADGATVYLVGHEFVTAY